MPSKRLKEINEKKFLQKREMFDKILAVEPRLIEELKCFIEVQENKKDKPEILKLVLKGVKIL